jgi:transcription initiation factor TFIIIB Brf1 subunit/transcription initiation factor TFIIB
MPYNYNLCYSGAAICPDCGNNQLVCDEREADLVCDRCGLVVDSHLMSTNAPYEDYHSEPLFGCTAAPTIIGATKHSKLNRCNRDAAKADKALDRPEDIAFIQMAVASLPLVSLSGYVL